MDIAGVPAEKLRSDFQNGFGHLLGSGGGAQMMLQQRESGFLFFHPLPFGDVTRHAHQSKSSPIATGDGRGAEEDGKYGPILPAAENLALPASAERLLENLCA